MKNTLLFSIMLLLLTLSGALLVCGFCQIYLFLDEDSGLYLITASAIPTFITHGMFCAWLLQLREN